MNKEIKKIAKENIFRDPINIIYEKSCSQLDDIFNKYAKALFEPIKYNPEDILNANQNIESNLLAIKKDYKDNKILKTKFETFGIGLGFPIFIGFIWLKKFKANRQKIKKHNTYVNLMRSSNNDLSNYKYNLVCSYFNSLSLNSLYDKIMNDLGIEVDYDFQIGEIENYLSYYNIVGVESVWKGWLRNTPIYDILAWHHYWENVLTSNCVTRSYTTTDRNGKTVVRSKTICASHSELTPFYKKSRHFLIKSRFAPNLEFFYSKPNSFKQFDTKRINLKGKKTQLENTDFNKSFPIIHNNGDEANFMTFFTTFNQENYLKWANTNSQNIPTYKQIQNTDTYAMFEDFITFQPVQNFNINHHIQCSLLDIYKVNDKTEVEKLLNQIFSDLKNITCKTLEAITWLFLNSNVNREDYTGSTTGLYFINNNIQTSIHKIQENYKQTYKDVYFKIKTYVPLWMTTNHADREEWIENGKIETNIHNTNVKKCELHLNSYFGVREIDNIPVFDVDCGTVIVPVPYVRYYPFKENKIILFINKVFLKDIAFTINSGTERKVFENQFTNNESFERTNNNKIWFHLKNIPMTDSMLNKINMLAEEFWKITKDKHFSLVSDNTGIYVSINEVDILDNVTYNNLVKFLAKF